MKWNNTFKKLLIFILIPFLISNYTQYSKHGELLETSIKYGLNVLHAVNKHRKGIGVGLLISSVFGANVGRYLVRSNMRKQINRETKVSDSELKQWFTSVPIHSEQLLSISISISNLYNDESNDYLNKYHYDEYKPWNSIYTNFTQSIEAVYIEDTRKDRTKEEINKYDVMLWMQENQYKHIIQTESIKCIGEKIKNYSITGRKKLYNAQKKALDQYFLENKGTIYNDYLDELKKLEPKFNFIVLPFFCFVPSKDNTFAYYKYFTNYKLYYFFLKISGSLFAIGLGMVFNNLYANFIAYSLFLLNFIMQEIHIKNHHQEINRITFSI